MGGLVISQFAEHDPSAVHDLVYVAGFLPVDGQTAIQLFDPASMVIASAVVNLADYTIGVPSEVLGPGFCADCKPRELELLQRRYRDEPLLPLLTPVHLTAGNWGTVPKKYLFTLDDMTITYPFQQAMASAVPLARTATMSSSHQPQLSRAGQLTDVLKDLVK